MPDDPKPFRCRICDKLRERDSNHWWIVLLRRIAEPDEHMEVRKWNSVLARRATRPSEPGNGFIYLTCGLRCLSTIVERCAAEMIERSKPNPEGETIATNTEAS